MKSDAARAPGAGDAASAYGDHYPQHTDMCCNSECFTAGWNARAAVAAHADWAPIGGERVRDLFTPIEARILDALLCAGKDEAGDFRLVPMATILRRAWGAEYAEEWYLLRVNVARIRHKLQPQGWDIINRIGGGYRLAPFDPAHPAGKRPVTDAERAEIVRLRATGLPLWRIAERVRRNEDAVRAVLRAAS